MGRKGAEKICLNNAITNLIFFSFRSANLLQRLAPSSGVTNSHPKPRDNTALLSSCGKGLATDLTLVYIHKASLNLGVLKKWLGSDTHGGEKNLCK